MNKNSGQTPDHDPFQRGQVAAFAGMTGISNGLASPRGQPSLDSKATANADVPPPVNPAPGSNDFEKEPTTIPAVRDGRRELLYGLIAASFSGILWFVACPTFDLWLLAWVAMIPVLFAAERASSMRRALLFAWWAALVGNAGGFYWMVEVLQRFANLSWIAAAALFLLFCSYQALRLILFVWMFRGIRSRTNLPAALVAPILMVTAELCVPFIFPYYLAITQAQQLHVIQIADLTGPLGVTALLLMINGALYDVAAGGHRRLASAAIAFAILAGALVYGHVRIKQFSQRRAEAPKLKVGVVQPNIAFDQKTIGGPLKNNLADIQAQSAKLEEQGAELIVWPETIYPSYIWRHVPGDWHEDHPLRIRRGFTTPLIFGARTADLLDRNRYRNSALMLDRNGMFTGKYDKSNLVVFGEYVPGVEIFPSLQQLVPDSVGGLTPGRDVSVIPFKAADGRQWRLGPTICLEDVIPDAVRKLARLRPHLLVNITDDSWFGDTSEPWQHLALSVYRTVELRTEMVRAVNPGVSAYVDATGRIYAKTYSLDPAKNPRGSDSILAEVALIEGGDTVYASVGDLFGYVSVAITMFLWLVLPRLHNRRSLQSVASGVVRRNLRKLPGVAAWLCLLYALSSPPPAPARQRHAHEAHGTAPREAERGPAAQGTTGRESGRKSTASPHLTTSS